MKLLNLLLATAVVMAFNGCLTADIIDYRISISPDGHKATSETVYHDIRGHDAGEQLGIDFAELIDTWKGKQYVSDRRKEGVNVIKRNLAIEKGKLVGRQTSTFSDTSSSFRNLFSRDSMRLAFKRKDVDTIIRTNGKIRRTRDSIFIVWPKNIHDYRLSMKSSAANAGDHVDLVPRFQEYLKSESSPSK